MTTHQIQTVPTRKKDYIITKDIETSRNIAVLCHDSIT